MKRYWLLALLLTGCAGTFRGCSSHWAEMAGADWIVVQYAADGHPIHCWRLNDVSITNEQSSDGVYWKAASGHLVHISGWYNRVQVSGGNYESALKELGLTRCEEP